MELTGRYQLTGTRQDVWEALNVPDRLQRIIPGCTEIVSLGDETFKARVTTRVGPLKVNFVGTVKYINLVPFESFSVEGQGEGGPAGFAKGRVDITLVQSTADTTELSYSAYSNVGGKLASLGGRLLEAVSRHNIDKFFAALQKELGAEAPAVSLAPSLAPGAGAQSQNRPTSVLSVINTVLLAAIAVAVWIIALK